MKYFKILQKYKLVIIGILFLVANCGKDTNNENPVNEELL